MKNIVFLCSPKYLELASTVLRVTQLCHLVTPVIERYGYSVSCRIGDCRNCSLIILTKGFLIDATLSAILKLKQSNNVLIADYVDHKPDLAIAEIVDGFMASSYRQYEYFRSLFPAKPCHLVTHNVDQRIAQIIPPSDGLRVGYFGELYNARYIGELSALVQFIRTDVMQPDQRWQSQLSRFNCHYAVRRRQAWDGFKPFLKGFLAAHCGSPIVTDTTEGDASYFLPNDYPFLVSTEGTDAVTTTIRQAKDLFGGIEWNYACEAMREVRERSSASSVIIEFEKMITYYLAGGFYFSARRMVQRAIGVVYKGCAAPTDEQGVAQS
jgi:hypothetical protein